MIITGALPNEVHFSLCDNTICLKDSRQRDLIKGWSNTNCKKLIFKKSQETQIIFGCKAYLNGKLYRWSPDYPIIVSHGSDQQLKLHLPFKKDDAVIDLYYKHRRRRNSLQVFFEDLNKPNHFNILWNTFTYLVVAAGDPKPTQLDAQILVNGVRFQFRASIQFSDKLVRNDEICQFVIETLKMSFPRGFVFKNLNLTYVEPISRLVITGLGFQTQLVWELIMQSYIAIKCFHMMSRWPY